jgi:hypothetical protein
MVRLIGELNKQLLILEQKRENCARYIANAQHGLVAIDTILSVPIGTPLVPLAVTAPIQFDGQPDATLQTEPVPEPAHEPLAFTPPTQEQLEQRSKDAKRAAEVAELLEDMAAIRQQYGRASLDDIAEWFGFTLAHARELVESAEQLGLGRWTWDRGFLLAGEE